MLRHKDGLSESLPLSGSYNELWCFGCRQRNTEHGRFLGDSLPNEDVLAILRAWNDKTLAEIKWRTEHYEIAFSR